MTRGFIIVVIVNPHETFYSIVQPPPSRPNLPLSLSLSILLLPRLSPIRFLPPPSILLSRNRLFLVIKSFKVLRALVKNDEKNLPRWLPTIEDKCLRVLQSSTCTRYDTLFRCVWFPLPSFFFFSFFTFSSKLSRYVTAKLSSGVDPATLFHPPPRIHLTLWRSFRNHRELWIWSESRLTVSSQQAVGVFSFH